MAQIKPKQTKQEDTPEPPLSDNERIDLIANLLLDYLDEEQQRLDEGEACTTTQTKML